MARVYLDHAATTPMLPGVLDVYLDALRVVGNPSSIHADGQHARRMLEEARESIADGLDCEPVELIFTSGGTESINLALKGMWWARQADAARPRLVVPGGEHHATVDAVEWLASAEGAVVETVPLDAEGTVTPGVLAQALAPSPVLSVPLTRAAAPLVPFPSEGSAASDVALATVIWANNEVGTVQPVAELTAVAAAAGVPLHVDAVAALGYVPVSFRASGAAALSVSAHKIGGPVGIGALVQGRSTTVTPLIHGGNQQRARSGTQDVAGAIAFAEALRLATTGLDAFASRLAGLRDRLVAGIRSAVPEAVLRGPADSSRRLPGNAHFTFPGCDGDSLLFLLDAAGVSVSTGSACQAGVPETSHVLLDMGVPEHEARGALRFTLGHGTTEADVDALVAALPDAYARASRAGLASA